MAAFRVKKRKKIFTGKVDLFQEEKKKLPPMKVAFEYDGWPVIKYGYDKFLGIMLIDNNLRFVFGEFTKAQTGEWIPDKTRAIPLKGSHMCKLVALTLSGQLDPLVSYQQNIAAKRRQLGDGIRVSWSWFGNARYIHINTYKFDETTRDLERQGNGVTLSEGAWGMMKSMMKDGSLFEEIGKVLVRRKPGGQVPRIFNQTPLLSILPQVMFKHFDIRLTEKCDVCVGQLEHYEQLVEAANKPGHTHCRYSGKVRLGTQMEEAIMENMEIPVKCWLLTKQPWGDEQPTTDLVKAFDVYHLLDVNRASLRWSLLEVAKQAYALNYDIEFFEEHFQRPVEDDYSSILDRGFFKFN